MTQRSTSFESADRKVPVFMAESLAGALPISSLTALHDEGHLSLPVRYAGRVLSAIRDAIAWVSHSYGVRLQDATPASRAALAEDASGLRMMTLSRPGVHVRRWCTDKRTAWIAGLGG